MGFLDNMIENSINKEVPEHLADYSWQVKYYREEIRKARGELKEARDKKAAKERLDLPADDLDDDFIQLHIDSIKYLENKLRVCQEMQEPLAKYRREKVAAHRAEISKSVEDARREYEETLGTAAYKQRVFLIVVFGNLILLAGLLILIFG